MAAQHDRASAVGNGLGATHLAAQKRGQSGSADLADARLGAGPRSNERIGQNAAGSSAEKNQEAMKQDYVSTSIKAQFCAFKFVFLASSGLWPLLKAG
jgi:hypothetical protein